MDDEIEGLQGGDVTVEGADALRRDRAVIDADAAASMSPDEHRRGFAAAVGYRQGILWLSREELTETIGTLREVLTVKAVNEPTPGRSPHLVSAIFFPAEAPPQHRTNR